MFRALNKFWFETRSVEALGFFRIIFGCILLLITIISFPNWDRFYGPWGTLPSIMIRDQTIYYWSLFNLSQSTAYLWALYWLLLLAVCCFIVGVRTKLATVIIFLIYASMVNRNAPMVNGQDQVAVLLLFFSCFSPLGGALSIDRYRTGEPWFSSGVYEIWGLRLMQISFLMIYAFCGPTKLQSWSDGDAIYYVSLSEAWFRWPHVEWFHNIWFSKLATYGTVIVETAFPLLIWIKSIRSYLLVSMFLLHFGIMIFLSSAVFYFNLVMVTGLCIFIENQIIRKITKPHTP